MKKNRKSYGEYALMVPGRRLSNNKKKQKGVTFAFTYHPLLKPLQSLIKRHLKILNIGEEVW